MKTILLTGATGFLGSRLAELIKNEYADRYEPVLLTSKEILGYRCILHRDYGYSATDFIDGGVFHVDIVIHVGWFVAKNHSDRSDVAKNFSPLENTWHLLTNLPNIPEQVIFCSSTDVYGGTGTDEVYKKGGLINEKSPVNLVTLYGLSKYNTELLVRDWAEQHDCKCCILRLGPLYGVGDKRKEYLVGAMLKKAAEGENLSLYADKAMKRNLLYVDDCVRFIMRSIRSEETPAIINVVSSHNPSMLEMVEAICEAADHKIDYDVKDCEHKGKDLAYDASVREQYLGGEAFSLIDGMRAALAWNREYYCSRG